MSTSEVLSASANSPPRAEPSPTHVQSLAWLRRGLGVFALVAGVASVAMTVSNGGFDDLDTPNGLKVLIGWSFAGCGLYAWERRPENRLGPLMTAVGCTSLLANILIQSHSSALFTAGIWLSDAWVVVFVCFLLAFPLGRLKPGFDLFVIGLFALMAFPLELAWLLFLETGGTPENALMIWPNAAVADHIDSAQRALVTVASVVLAITLTRRWIGRKPATPTWARTDPRWLRRHLGRIGPRRARQVSDRVRNGALARARCLRCNPPRRPRGHSSCTTRTLDRRGPPRRASWGAVAE